MTDAMIAFIIIGITLAIWGIFELVQAFRKARHEKMKTDKLLGVWKGNDEGQGSPASSAREGGGEEVRIHHSD